MMAPTARVIARSDARLIWMVACVMSRSSDLSSMSSIAEVTHRATNEGTSAPNSESFAIAPGRNGFQGLTAQAPARPPMASQRSEWWM